MGKRLNMEGLEQALKNLGELLERDSDAETLHLVVCGGSSLLARQMLENRQFTRDVDVLAIIEKGDNTLVSARPLPESLLRAARTTAQVMDLFEDWINDGPTDLLDGGLPEGFIDRLEPHDFGTRLKVSSSGGTTRSISRSTPRPTRVLAGILAI